MNCLWRLLFLRILPETFTERFMNECSRQHWMKQSPSDEDGPIVKPKHAWLNDPNWQSSHPVTNKWDPGCCPLTLAGRHLHPPPPTIYLLPPWAVCVFVKQWISLCFPESWQGASRKLKMGAERLYGSLNKQPDRKDVWQAKVSG